MKLYIQRDQAKKLLGGVKFELSGRVELTPAESELVRKYKVEKETLVKSEVKIPFTGRSISIDLTIGTLMDGQTFKCNDIAEILEMEKTLKDSCGAFKHYLDLMNHFGGEEVIEFGDEETSRAAAAGQAS